MIDGVSAALPSRRQRADCVVRRNQTVASEFQRRLADAIERLVDEGASYAQLSVERLVGEAGIARSTFYKYFGDKSGLLSSLVGAVQDDFLHAADAWLELTAGAAKSDYEAAFAAIFDAYRSHRVVMRCIVEQANQDPVIRDHFTGMMAAFVAAIEEHIRLGQEANAITSDHSAHDLALWLTWMLEYGQLQLVGPAVDRDLKKYTSAVTDVVWRALYSELTGP
ncbi:HTH-type transcriptional regulator EthR [Mycobacterium talmoniae]|uniref:HTH-type transcriptional regulator EthR n=1 Tax=Mycobacterium talmoniae TaxID=1858794 RepID=A0A2S8BEU5_9MYCO|nr:HTH-type transcriptional regulator EthR [Mycobacterium talmoniae]